MRGFKMSGFDSKLTSQVDSRNMSTNTTNNISEGNLNATNSQISTSKSDVNISDINYAQTYNVGLQGNDLMNVVHGISGTASQMVGQTTQTIASILGVGKEVGKYLLYALGALIVGVVGFFVIRKMRKKKA